jgi:hypothetical protein
MISPLVLVGIPVPPFTVSLSDQMSDNACLIDLPISKRSTMR